MNIDELRVFHALQVPCVGYVRQSLFTVPLLPLLANALISSTQSNKESFHGKTDAYLYCAAASVEVRFLIVLFF
jgi:hypothetical protein